MQMRCVYVGCLNVSADVFVFCTDEMMSLHDEDFLGGLLFIYVRPCILLLWLLHFINTVLWPICVYCKCNWCNQCLTWSTAPLCRCDISLQGAPWPLRSDLCWCQEGVSGELGGHGNARPAAGHVCRRIRQLWCWLAVWPDSPVSLSSVINAHGSSKAVWSLCCCHKR